MKELTDAELEDIAREAATGVAGLGTVERVKVATGLGSDDEAVYRFSFLIEKGRDPQLRGTSYTQLGIKLRDGLIERGDYCYPHIAILNRADWEKVNGA